MVEFRCVATAGPATTLPRILRPKLTTREEAWRVSSFLVPELRETAALTREIQTPEGEASDLAIARENGYELDSVVPAGEYMTLRVFYDDGWHPVMTDTPAEYNDHRDLFEHAHGRVLLHGLGLGCALSALLADPAIEHVDVVDANADVIAMVAPYYRGYPVTIHHASCVDKVWPAGTRWNYVWHDIWTYVDDANLDDATAEHGISYGRLAQMFADRADRQGAWAFDLV